MRALVLGLGESGLAIVRWLVREGWSVRVGDTRNDPPQLATLRAELAHVEFVGGGFATSLLDGIELVAISPGLSPQHSPARPVLCAMVLPQIGQGGVVPLHLDTWASQAQQNWMLWRELILVAPGSVSFVTN